MGKALLALIVVCDLWVYKHSWVLTVIWHTFLRTLVMARSDLRCPMTAPYLSTLHTFWLSWSFGLTGNLCLSNPPGITPRTPGITPGTLRSPCQGGQGFIRNMHVRKEAAGSLSLMALPSEESQSHIKLIGPWRRP